MERCRSSEKGFYGTFKDADAYLRFVLLTGVTKFSQVSVFSGFNQPKDISMDSKFDSILVKLLEGKSVNMQKLTEKSYTSDYFVDYRADAEDPLAMLYQSGYLTIKGYDGHRGKYTLDFPNDEVRSGFVTLISNSYFQKRSIIFLIHFI